MASFESFDALPARTDFDGLYGEGTIDACRHDMTDTFIMFDVSSMCDGMSVASGDV